MSTANKTHWFENSKGSVVNGNITHINGNYNESSTHSYTDKSVRRIKRHYNEHASYGGKQEIYSGTFSGANSVIGGQGNAVFNGTDVSMAAMAAHYAVDRQQYHYRGGAVPPPAGRPRPGPGPNPNPNKPRPKPTKPSSSSRQPHPSVAAQGQAQGRGHSHWEPRDRHDHDDDSDDHDSFDDDNTSNFDSFDEFDEFEENFDFEDDEDEGVHGWSRERVGVVQRRAPRPGEPIARKWGVDLGGGYYERETVRTHATGAAAGVSAGVSVGTSMQARAETKMSAMREKAAKMRERLEQEEGEEGDFEEEEQPPAARRVRRPQPTLGSGRSSPKSSRPLGSQAVPRPSGSNASDHGEVGEEAEQEEERRGGFKLSAKIGAEVSWRKDKKKKEKKRQL